MKPGYGLAALMLLASLGGCVSTYDERQEKLHEVVVYWQSAKSQYLDVGDHKVKVDTLPAKEGVTEMRLRHICSQCGLGNDARIAIVAQAADQVMSKTCSTGYTILEEGHTVEPLGLKRNYRTLSSGVRRYEFTCTG